jgi:hypothetical protein
VLEKVRQARRGEISAQRAASAIFYGIEYPRTAKLGADLSRDKLVADACPAYAQAAAILASSSVSSGDRMPEPVVATALRAAVARRICVKQPDVDLLQLPWHL